MRRADLAPAVFRAIYTQSEFEEFSELKLTPRFNIAPSQNIPIIRLNSKNQRVINSAQWGLIPSWVKGTPKSKPINARAETLQTSGMFRQAFQRRRCLVPADGFYEWQGAKPPKQPYFIHRPDNDLFAFAGLWERWKQNETDPPLDTVTIITTSANETMKPIHNRMPVILHEKDYDSWLSRDTPSEEVTPLLLPDPEQLQTDPISTKVNNVRNEGPDLLE